VRFCDVPASDGLGGFFSSLHAYASCQYQLHFKRASDWDSTSECDMIQHDPSSSQEDWILRFHAIKIKATLQQARR
jgi:hypothetical protein